MPPYVPQRGDIIYIDLNPQAGTEIAKRRPCLVLSPAPYNRLGKCIVCPITSTIRNLRTEVPLPDDQAKASGVILADQIKSLDWRVRKAQRFDRLQDERILAKVVAIVKVLIEGRA
jgi:mRNA interferase MazF